MRSEDEVIDTNNRQQIDTLLLQDYCCCAYYNYNHLRILYYRLSYVFFSMALTLLHPSRLPNDIVISKLIKEIFFKDYHLRPRAYI